MGRRNRKRKLNYFIDEVLLSFLGHRPIPVNWHLQMKLNGRLDERTRVLSAITATKTQRNKQIKLN